MELKDIRWVAFMFYVNIIFFFKLLTNSYKIINFNYTYITILILITFILFYVYKEVLVYKKHKAVAWILIIIASLIFIYFNKENIVMFNKSIIEDLDLLNKVISSGSDTNFNDYKRIITVVLPIICLVIFSLYYKGITHILLILTTFTMLFLWYLGYDTSVEESLFYYSLIVVINFSGSSNRINMKKMRVHNIRENIKSTSVITQTLFYGLLIAVLIKLYPVDIEGRYGNILKTKINSAITNENIEGSLNEKGYGLKVSGYNDSNLKLGGKIQLDNKEAFRVKTDQSYHLKGSVKSIYTGNSWVAQYEELQDIFKMRDTDSRYISYFGETKKSEMYIETTNIKTNTVFTPIYIMDINYPEGNKIYKNERADIYKSFNIIKEGYKLDFIDEYRMKPILINKGTDYAREDLYNYTQLPDSITERTKTLVEDIVKGIDNPLEKSKRIREYLESNYNYSLDVKDVPLDKDFVDYFLFEEKKGYCVYFATAATVMNRIAGVPSRYVEGFNMPKEKSYEDFYLVTNKDAHAWTEVLVDSKNMIWTIEDSSPTAREYESSLNENMPEVNINSAPDQELMQDPSKDKIDKNISDEENDINTNLDYSHKYNYVFIKVIIVIFIYMFINLVTQNRRKNKILKGDYKYSYFYLERRLKTIGIKRESNETEKDYINKISNVKLRNTCLELIECLYKDYYGGYKSKEFKGEEFYFNLEKYLKEIQGISYYIYKYIIFFRVKTTS
ncbi:transglutaminase-like domain-containing protein [Clostridium algidicarnis]|uniref:transglutaminase-like domain-containing protein n=1 Tax=Clostridium algidicarnis TaxID=37659 RepID=UPI003FD70B4B